MYIVVVRHLILPQCRSPFCFPAFWLFEFLAPDSFLKETRLVYFPTASVSSSLEFMLFASQRIVILMSSVLSELYGCICLREYWLTPVYCFCSLTPVYCFCFRYSSSGGENCLTLPIVPVSVFLKGELSQPYWSVIVPLEGDNCLDLYCSVIVSLFLYWSWVGELSHLMLFLFLFLKGELSQPYNLVLFSVTVPLEGRKTVSTLYCFLLLFLKGDTISTLYCFLLLFLWRGENCLDPILFPVTVFEGRYYLNLFLFPVCLSVHVLPRGRVESAAY